MLGLKLMPMLLDRVLNGTPIPEATPEEVTLGLHKLSSALEAGLALRPQPLSLPFALSIPSIAGIIQVVVTAEAFHYALASDTAGEEAQPMGSYPRRLS
jgi:hypothetical protein